MENFFFFEKLKKIVIYFLNMKSKNIHSKKGLLGTENFYLTQENFSIIN